MARVRHSKNRRRRIPRESVDDLFIVGLDAEWQTEGGQNRLLSFQRSVLYRGKESTGITFYDKGRRPKLADLIQETLTQARREGLFSHYPKQLFLVSHFTLAELSILADFPQLKSRFDSIRGSFTTLTEPFPVKVTDENRNQRVIDLHLRDSLHLTPQGAGLEVLGEIHGIAKVALPPGAIENMAHLLETDQDLFTRYAITDARIAAFHALEMAKLSREMTGECVVPITLGGIAVKFALSHWSDAGVEPLDLLGKVEIKDEEFDSRTGRRRKKKKKVLMASLHEYEALAVESYHGGRNEAFYFGPSPIDDWFDVDLKGAYSTALASVGMPRWLELRHTVDPDEFHAGVIGCARIQFEFPSSVRYPTLPVRLPNNLIFPLKGETYATAPEIELARELGASITIMSGIVIPMDTSKRPFESVISECTQRRNEAMRDGDDLGNRLYKEIGNSLYGKIAQGLREKRVFDSRSAERRNLPPSPITQPYIAAHVTGLVRTALGELMNSIGDDRTIISVTTDGFVVNASLDDLEGQSDGPSCRILRETRDRMLGDPSILEVKHAVQQLLCFRTRGQATLKLGKTGEVPLLAKAGIKPPPGIVGKDRQNEWIVHQFLERNADTTFRYKSLTTLRHLYETNGDLVAVGHERKLGMEFDFKRKPSIRWTNACRDNKSHLAFHTTPFASVEECLLYRESWKRFERSGHCLKTENDLRDFEEFLAGERLAESGINRSREGLPKVAMRQFLRRLVRGNCGLDLALMDRGYAEMADRLSDSGVQVTVGDLKNAKRPGVKLPSHSVPSTPEVMKLVHFLQKEFQGWDADEMLEEDCKVPGSGEAPSATFPETCASSEEFSSGVDDEKSTKSGANS